MVLGYLVLWARLLMADNPLDLVGSMAQPLDIVDHRPRMMDSYGSMEHCERKYEMCGMNHPMADVFDQILWNIDIQHVYFTHLQFFHAIFSFI